MSQSCLECHRAHERGQKARSQHFLLLGAEKLEPIGLGPRHWPFFIALIWCHNAMHVHSATNQAVKIAFWTKEPQRRQKNSSGKPSLEAILSMSELCHGHSEFRKECQAMSSRWRMTNYTTAPSGPPQRFQSWLEFVVSCSPAPCETHWWLRMAAQFPSTEVLKTCVNLCMKYPDRLQ